MVGKLGVGEKQNQQISVFEPQFVETCVNGGLSFLA